MLYQLNFNSKAIKIPNNSSLVDHILKTRALFYFCPPLLLESKIFFKYKKKEKKRMWVWLVTIIPSNAGISICSSGYKFKFSSSNPLVVEDTVWCCNSIQLNCHVRSCLINLIGILLNELDLNHFLHVHTRTHDHLITFWILNNRPAFIYLWPVAPPCGQMWSM